MKLAHWCLNLKLIAEAKEQLIDVAKHNPNHPQAYAMLVSIEQAATRAAYRQRDPEVRQTRADEMTDQRPGALDSAVLRRAQRELGISNLPVIFDLPVPVAVKRAEEFARYINPLLQVNCAKCHNGEYEGAFQLVSTKSRADRTPEALRANLDATLRLVDPKNPAHSELLSSTLRAHGRGPRPRPIFPGSNDATYQILANWVHKLCPPVTGADAKRTERGQIPTEGVETFAVDRDQIGRDRPDQTAPAVSGRAGSPELAAGTPARTRIPPPSRFVPGGSLAAEGSNPADPQEFPLPFAITGVKPNLPPAHAASKPTTTGPGGSAAKPASPSAPNASGEQAKGKDGSGGTAKKTSKPLTLDPALLERTLKSLNPGR